MVTTVLKNRIMQLGLIVLFSTLPLVMSLTHVDALTISSSRDCDTNAVIKCGVLSTDELRQKYDANSSTRAIYSFFGINSEDISALHSSGKTGFVTKSGNVIVNGKVVATNALTVGKQDMPGSTKVTPRGNVFFTRPPSVSFSSDRLAAFVKMKDGQFDFAVIASCGNPVKATAVAQPTPPPASTPTQPQPTPPAPQPSPTTTPAPPAPQVSQVQQVSQPVVQSVNVTQTVTTPAAQQTPASTPTPAPVKTLPNTGLASVVKPAILVMFVAIASYYITTYVRRKLIV